MKKLLLTLAIIAVVITSTVAQTPRITLPGDNPGGDVKPQKLQITNIIQTGTPLVDNNDYVLTYTLCTGTAANPTAVAANITYYVVADGDTIQGLKTDTNGQFKLKNGNTAVFTINSNIYYSITEVATLWNLNEVITSDGTVISGIVATGKMNTSNHTVVFSNTRSSAKADASCP